MLTVLSLLSLLQQGKGEDVGASFSGGASGTVFGSAGCRNFLSRTTAVLAGLSSLLLRYQSILAHQFRTKIKQNKAHLMMLSGTAEQIQQQQQPKRIPAISSDTKIAIFLSNKIYRIKLW